MDNETYRLNKLCVDYILESESDDYFSWCIDENRDAEKYSANTAHVYACAVLVKDNYIDR